MFLQLLVTTMHQSDFSRLEQMNIRGNVLFANQADRFDLARQTNGNHTASMVTTPTRGLSKNRNIAMEFADSTAEFLLFSDDDLVFHDDYERRIREEFERHPEANAIKFNLYDISPARKISMSRIRQFKRATRLNITSSGVCGLAIRQRVLKKCNLKFNETFGTGTENYCGEDTIFLQELVRADIGFYLSPVEIAGIDQTESSWFEGYNEKYFTVSGKTLAAIYPRLAKLIAIRSAYKFTKRECKLPFQKILDCYWKGIREYLRK